MNANLTWFERGLRFLVGVTLLAWAFAGGPWWAYAGIILIANGAWGFCPVYWSLKINSQ